MAMSSPFIPVLAALVVGLAVGLALGILGAALMGRGASERERDASAALGQELATLRVAQARTETELAGLQGRQGSIEEAAAQAVDEHRAMQRELSEARISLGEATTQLAAERESAEQRLLVERVAAADRLEAEREAAASRLALERCAADEKLLLLAEARVELGNQFKMLAAEIFDEKSKRFGEQNQASMDTLLAPLKEKLGEFQQRVEGFSNESRVGRGELRTHIETAVEAE